MSVNQVAPGQLFKRATPIDCDEEDCEECGTTEVLFGEQLSRESPIVYKATTKDGVEVTMTGVDAGNRQAKSSLDKEISFLKSIGKHANIIDLMQTCDIGIRYYMMTELLTGGALETTMLAKTYVRNEALTKTIMGQIMTAVKFIHGKGIAHCNLKPANVMFDGTGAATVVDFGAATKEKTVASIDVADGIVGPGKSAEHYPV